MFVGGGGVTALFSGSDTVKFKKLLILSPSQINPDMYNKSIRNETSQTRTSREETQSEV